MERTKSCPICRAEYRPQVQSCPDCAVPLEWNPEPDEGGEMRRTLARDDRPAVNKICPLCRSEYQPHVQMCVDCEVQLEWNRGVVDLEVLRRGTITETDTDWSRFEENEILGLLVGDVEWAAAAYIRFLREEGIPAVALPRMRYLSGEVKLSQSMVFGIQLEGGGSNEVPVGDLAEGFQFDLFVRERDHEAGDRIVDEHFEALHPEQKEGFYQEFETDKCPACGHSLEGSPEECPDCGLYLAG